METEQWDRVLQNSTKNSMQLFTNIPEMKETDETKCMAHLYHECFALLVEDTHSFQSKPDSENHFIKRTDGFSVN